MPGNGGRDRSDMPLLGAVLCCTSVPPEERTRYADFAHQMGAEHKLDLTSHVTHLLVGDTNTLKYQYVAREREDVKVLRPEWVEAVRQCWMNDEALDLDALEEKYRLPTFAGLKVCITGWDDLIWRAQLQKAIVDHGAEYTGDLTKDVTHLIANAPEGKKYEYATHWQKKIVGLKWLKDSIERGMQLDESLYHPTKPVKEQGLGAWNRAAKQTTQLGKRQHDEPPAAEPPRKLRRTASAKLGSQNENLWGDIVGGGGFEPSDRERDTLRPSTSMPAIRLEKQVSVSFAEGSEADAPVAPEQRRPQGFFMDRHFSVHRFDSQKVGVLHDIIVSNGGIMTDSLEAVSHIPQSNKFILVPYTTPKSDLFELLDGRPFSNIVSELWVECCMERKACVPPSQYPFGGLLEQYPIRGFESLVVSSTGFLGIEPLHVSKVVKLMGAKYEQVFTPKANVLVCKTLDPTAPKVRHAQEWKVPAVSEAWLWSCLKTCQLRPIDEYKIKSRSVGALQQVNASKRTEKDRTKESVREASNCNRKQDTTLQVHEKEIYSRQKPSVEYLSHGISDKQLLPKEKPGSDFFEETPEPRVQPKVPRNKDFKSAAPTKTLKARGESPDSDGNGPLNLLPLQEISTNSPPKSRTPSPVKKKQSLFRSFVGNGSVPETERGLPPTPSAADVQPIQSNGVNSSNQDINGAIHVLLDRNAKAKIDASSSNSEVSRAKRKLVGRALSNLSNSSMGTVRASRASSVDSMNTDGVGSEIVAEISQATRRAGSGNIRASFTGRARPREPVGKGASIELGEDALYRNDFLDEGPSEPQRTQLAYEDAEEAIMLRRKLAEKRREQSREGQVDEDVKVRTAEKRIRDDDALLENEASWGAGRRTRQKEVGLKGLKDF